VDGDSSACHSEAYWFERWDATLCSEAAAIDAVCIDVPRALTEPMERNPLLTSSPVTTRTPRQKGNDVIIGFGCLSLRMCRLINRDDVAAADGPGSYLLDERG